VEGSGVSTPYSRRPEWVAATRAFLISVRHRPDSDMPRYGEIAEVYGGTARMVAVVLTRWLVTPLRQESRTCPAPVVWWTPDCRGV
jgi:hypothetical protein